MSGPFTDRDAVPEITPTYRLQWEEAQDCYVLLYPEGMVKLNPSAAEILKRCDGETSVQTLIGDLNAQFPDADIESDVDKFLCIAYEESWIRTKQSA